MDINLPQIKINKKKLQLNLAFFEEIYIAIQKARENSQNTIFLEDSYYNSFYDGEISLFWLFFKLYVGFKNLENNISNNFDCLHILNDDSLTNVSKEHVLKFFHDIDIDFFTNLKRINPSKKSIILKYNLEDNKNYKKFIEYINCCGPDGYWRFIEKNIEKTFSVSVSNEFRDSNDKEKFFFAKKIYDNKFDSFYYISCLAANINKEEFQFKSKFINLLNQIIKINDSFDKLIVLLEVHNEIEVNLLKEFLNDIKDFDFYEKLLFIILYKKHIRNFKLFESLTYEINSSIVFHNGDYSSYNLAINNSAALFLIAILKNKYKENTNNDYIERQKIRKLSHLVFKSIFTGRTKSKELKRIFNDLFRFSKTELLNEINVKIDGLNNNLEENIFNLEPMIITHIKELNIKQIFISKSNFYLTNEDLHVFKDWLIILINNSNISIEVLNKSYPLELSQESLLIYLGEDLISRYFNKKIRILNIKLNYNMEKLDFDMVSDLEKRKENIFLIKSHHNSEVIPSNKQVLYFFENDFNIYTDNIQDIYEDGTAKAFILTDYSDIKEYCQNFIKNYSKNSQTRNKIKLKANEKIFNKNNKLKYNRKQYYLYLSDLFILTLNDNEKKYYSNLIKNNLHSWFEKITLPRDSLLFLKFLDFINLKEEAKILFNDHRYETSLNQSGGRDVSKQIQTIFDKEWDNNEDYDNLIKELKSSGLFKECTITIKNGE